jgi:phosphoglycolate phosphatase
VTRPPRQPTVLLFDIDGTLLPTLGLGRTAMERAFADVVQRTGGLDGVHFEGMTDRPIVRAGLVNLGLATAGEAPPAIIDQILARYLLHLATVVAAAAPLPLLPGVTEVLDIVTSWPLTAVGLGTGNLRAGAELKLAAAGLWDRFAFGGFACDHEDRGILLRVGATRGAALLGVPLRDCRVVVIGDTPRDVAAAEAIAATSVAVATSRHTVEALTVAGASLAVADLRAPSVLPALAGDPGAMT